MLKVYRMRVLALDTTERAGSVALVEDGRIVLERRGDGSRTHGERLPGELAGPAIAHQGRLPPVKGSKKSLNVFKHVNAVIFQNGGLNSKDRINSFLPI